MRVKELIEKLQLADPEDTVYFSTNDGHIHHTDIVETVHERFQTENYDGSLREHDMHHVVISFDVKKAKEAEEFITKVESDWNELVRETPLQNSELRIMVPNWLFESIGKKDAS